MLTPEGLDPHLLRELHGVDVLDFLLEPALLVGNLHVIPGHLTLLHQAVLCERPILRDREITRISKKDWV